MNHFWETVDGHAHSGLIDLYRETVRDAKSPAVFVEVGSWKGQSAAFMAVEIINSGKDIKFFCVDNCLGISFAPPNDIVEFLGKPLQDIFWENMKRGGVDHIINAIWKQSIDAAKDFKDRSIDFGFIDADHAYEHVHEDILAWLPKVKVGGVLAGHDYRDPQFPGVDRAVDELLPGAYLFGKHCWVYRNDSGSSG